MGNTLRDLGRFDEAEASYTQAIALKPNFTEAHYNLANTFKELGRFEEAEASYSRAIKFKPECAEAHRQLASLKTFDEQDEQHAKMLELYLDDSISEDQRCHINFGLAKAFEDLGDFGQAFTHYCKGNALRRKMLSYDINQDMELFERIKTNYPRIKRNSLDSSEFLKSLSPIFIVGMLRSGTTLVEQIISSHPRVTGAGELPYIHRFGAAIANGFS